MTRLAIVLVVVALTMLSGCCRRYACDLVARPIENVEIEQGVAGYAAQEGVDGRPSDLCAECALSYSQLTIVRSAEPIDDAEAATQLLASEDAEHIVVDVEQRFELETIAGDYIACTHQGREQRCAPVKVEAGRVTTVHDVGAQGLAVFAATGERDDREFFVGDG